jgi:hypothetical protein
VEKEKMQAESDWHECTSALVGAIHSKKAAVWLGSQKRSCNLNGLFVRLQKSRTVRTKTQVPLKVSMHSRGNAAGQVVADQRYRRFAGIFGLG